MNVNYGKIALVLAAIGAINWALSMHDMNLVSMIPSKQIRTIVYYLIALAGAYLLVQILINKKENYIYSANAVCYDRLNLSSYNCKQDSGCPSGIRCMGGCKLCP